MSRSPAIVILNFGKILGFWGKVLRRRIKTHPSLASFTICLPGSPKVNAGGAFGAWLPGRDRAEFRFDERIEGTGGLFCLEVHPQPGMTKTSLAPELAGFAGATFDELVQWMV